MTAPAWVFLEQEGEPIAARIVRVCEEALREGPMGNHLRGEFYRQFISCGLNPAALTAEGKPGDIGALHTSCGIFAGAVLHWAGRRRTKPGRIAGALIGNWVHGVRFQDAAWCWAEKGVPEPGAIFYRDLGRGEPGFDPTSVGHVGIFLEQTGAGLWRTAEGGGNDLPAYQRAGLSPAQIKTTNGTVCKLSAREGKEVRAKDSLARSLIGWWRPALLGIADEYLPDAEADTMPPPPGEGA